jgi:hypothetical protein
MNIKVKSLAVATFAASLSGLALAGGKGAPDFSQLDNDNDSVITRSDLSNADSAHAEELNEKWSELDTNRDGRLDRSEFARFETMDEGSDAHDKRNYGTDQRGGMDDRDYGTGQRDGTDNRNYDADANDAGRGTTR